MTVLSRSRYARPGSLALGWALLAGLGACSQGDSTIEPLVAEMPLHLEEHLDVATLEGSEVPSEPLAPVAWRFDEPRPEWRPVVPPSGVAPLQAHRGSGFLRLTLTEKSRLPQDGRLWGAISVDLPDLRLADWGSILVRARTSDLVGDLAPLLNLYQRADRRLGLAAAARPLGGAAPIFSDGAPHTYAFRTDQLFLSDRRYESDRRGGAGRAGARDFAPWHGLAIDFLAEGPASIDLLSVTLVPAEAGYADARAGVRMEIESSTSRRTLYTHAPGKVEYRLQVPPGGRLDVGLGVLRVGGAVTFRISATPEGDEVQPLLEESYSDHRNWALRSVDLSHLARRTATLTLEADAERSGSVALWAAPTISGVRASDRPDVVFYVIDGGGADHTSVYDYNRRTTPTLERLAEEGAVFDRAYSNSTHTSASTPSFVTSLHTSVLGVHDGARMIPREPVSMAERLHAIGYQTALFSANPHAGWYSGLDRGFDILRDAVLIDDSMSSVPLHDDFWSWRAAYPGEPYFVHFQTTDVHGPWIVTAPFAGLFVEPELRARHVGLEERLRSLRGGPPTLLDYTEAGVDLAAHVNVLGGLYDEAMAHQDFQLGQLVKRLKQSGDWEHTLLIVAADHAQWAGGLRDPRLNPHDPMFRSSVTRVPLLFVWPGHIAGGQRFSQPVSMIDVLPTILDLVGLPESEAAQGQSLAPLLLGKEGWEPRPVILDEFELDAETGELTGVIEVVDGRWGASLLIKPRPGAWPESQREAPLLLYDLWSDPFTMHSLDQERPDLAEHYTALLEARFKEHRALAQSFTRSDPLAMTPEQLEALRALGYIR